MRVLFAVLLFLLPASAFAADLEIEGRFEQGGLAIGTVPMGATVSYNGKPVQTTYVGRFVVGFERDMTVPAKFDVKLPDGRVESRTIQIQPRQWPTEKVTGLPPKLVKPDKKTQTKIDADNKLMAAVRQRTESVPFFETGFMVPAEGKISGVFGSQRVLNGQPRDPHLGLDIAGPVGTPVRASADGVVSLAQKDMVLTGQTVVIEHGFGLDTVYIHMNAIRVKDGQSVKQGDIIGEIGKSGRANGPHLHFGVMWFDVRLDPQVVMAVLPPRLVASGDGKPADAAPSN
ncbi:MAG: M23 family metallopeptidase [Rhodospirillaceae bacterium]|nr:M23 family metallopeptidase [Rhodospirillaceae bacterium]